MSVMIAILVIAFVVALLTWAHANRRIAESGVPDGRIVYQDADKRRVLERPLVSARYGLTGRPDYLVETPEGVVPVEIKSRDCPKSGPYASDSAQVTAYCVLVEETSGAAPPYGMIQYANRNSQIPYNSRGRERVQQIITEMRQARNLQTVHRSHTQAGRCRACGFRSICDERIQ